VPRFVVPNAEQVRAVLSESHAIWGAGLSALDYVAMWEEMADVPWARSWYSWRALVDERGRVLSSLKLYRPAIRIGAATGRAAAIGAVFTSPLDRRRGHASSLIRETLAEAERRGDAAALLFTDIGTEYYRAMGFTPLPCEDAVGSLSGAGGRAPRGVSFRPMTFDDLDAVARAQSASSSDRSFAVLRDREHWEFLLLRAATFFNRLDGSGLERRFMIATDDGRPIGYVVAVSGPGEWNLREADAFDGQPETLALVLTAAAADARAASAATVWGWIPRSVWAIVPEWRLRAQPRLRAIPMIRTLDGRALPAAAASVDGAFIPYLDQF
jgi:GNAT superfamily N-acetyltransferase